MKKNNEKKKNTLPSEIDSILDAIHDDILITDGQGIVLKVSATFETVYGINREDAIGMSVLELEEQGYFKPSITAVVLKSGGKITMRQKNNKNRDIVVTATPVKNMDGSIKYVISFSRDITEFLYLQEQYSELASKVEKYEEELNKLRKDTLEIEGIIAKSQVMQNVLAVVNRVAPFDANVLISGETGVGKSMLSKEMHKRSKRSKGPFIAINCGAIPENLLESELFGYEKGSFTNRRRKAPAFRHVDISRSLFFSFLLHYILPCCIIQIWNINQIIMWSIRASIMLSGVRSIGGKSLYQT